MNNKNITARALKLYHGYNPKYFPIRFLQIFFDSVAPYFTLWMSSEIVSALYEGRTQREVTALIVVILAGNLLIRIAGSCLDHSAKTQRRILLDRETIAFHQKTMSLDYDKLENAQIRQHRRQVEENTHINGYGMEFMKSAVEMIWESAISLMLSAIVFTEMLALLADVGIQPFSVLLIVVMVLCVILNIVFGAVRSKKLADAHKQMGACMLETNRLGRGYPRNAMDSRIYKQAPLAYYRLDLPQYRRHLKTMLHMFEADCKTALPMRIANMGMELCAFLLVCYYCTLGVFPMGSVIKYVGSLEYVTGSISNLAKSMKDLKNNEQYLETYLSYFDIHNDMYQGSLSVEKRSDKKFDIEFRHVSFRYQGAENDALQDINLTLGVGERLAVVGENGSGKTTFIKLLCRLYDPTKGEIYMNDFNIRKYDYRQYLDLFSVVFQDYQLLSLPLGHNVACADTWDSAKTERLLEQVGFGERYRQMPKKLETALNKDFDEEGVKVSGGEAQKIALARALYKNAPFIILDEPTAALDPIAEAEIYSRFDQIVGDKTAIYISHRLSSCRFCDKIAVFDQGRIVQVGTHEELLADVDGKYYELWHAQAQYYTESA